MSGNRRNGMDLLKKRPLTLGAAALVGLAFFLTGCGQEKDEMVISQELIVPQEANYRTSEVNLGTYEYGVSGSVSVVYPKRAELKWEKSGSRCQELLVSGNQKVSEGDVLITFDTGDSQAALTEAKLKLERLSKELETGKAERAFDIQDAKNKLEQRRTELSKRLKEEELEASSELKIMELKIEKQQISLEQFVWQTEHEMEQLSKTIDELSEELSENVLLAPFDGVIDQVTYLRPGDVVDPDVVLVSMHSESEFLLEASDQLKNLCYNADVAVEAGMKDARTSYEARVISAANVLPRELSDAPALLLVSQEASAEDFKRNPEYFCLSKELGNVLLMEKKGIRNEDGKTYVYVLEDGMMKKRYVTAALSGRADKVWILEGLKDGAFVILD